MSVDSPKWWAVVPAAGYGSRMASAVPKQYLSINGETLLSHSVKRLLGNAQIEQVVVAVAREDERWHELAILSDLRVTVVIGGAERADSVLAGLRALKRAAASDWVLVHDAARPCVRASDIGKMMRALADDPVGGIMAVPVADTLKRANPAGQIEQTVDRSKLWAAQTPQLFRVGLLREALQQAIDQGRAVTDEASAIEQAGYTPQLYAGSSRNIKITHPEDLELAAMILESQRHG